MLHSAGIGYPLKLSAELSVERAVTDPDVLDIAAEQPDQGWHDIMSLPMRGVCRIDRSPDTELLTWNMGGSSLGKVTSYSEYCPANMEWMS